MGNQGEKMLLSDPWILHCAHCAARVLANQHSHAVVKEKNVSLTSLRQKMKHGLLGKIHD